MEKNIFEIDIDIWQISFCYKRIKGLNVVPFTFCIKTPQDKYSYRIVKTLLGMRFKNKQEMYIYCGNGISEYGIQKAVVLEFARLLYNREAFIHHPHIPQGLVNYFNSKNTLELDI